MNQPFESHLAVDNNRIPNAAAKEMATWIESVLSADDQPLGYLESFLVGVWRRLTDRRRLVAPMVWDACVALRAVGISAANELDGTRWLDLRDPMPIFWELTATRVAVATDGDDFDVDDREEVLAVLDGLIGAVSAGRTCVAGSLAGLLEELGLGQPLRSRPVVADARA